MNIIKKYPDGASYADVPYSFDPYKNIFRVNSYEQLWHLGQFVEGYINRFNKKPTIVIPNLIDAPADRRFRRGQSSGLKQVCKFLNALDADFSIYHPHNPEVVEALMDNVTIQSNSIFINTVLHDIYTPESVKKNDLDFPTMESESMDIDKNLILMSADAGGFKPLVKLADDLSWRGEIFSASKARKFTPGVGSILTQIVDRQDFGGKDILIVDDFSIYGGTFLGLAAILKGRNIGKLYLAVSHVLVPNPNEDLFEAYDAVYTTNSKFNSYPKIKADNFIIKEMFPSNLIINEQKA